MGVPVVTVCGETFAGRHATSLLRTVGLDELVFSNFDDYVKYVVNLASNPIQLQKHREGLRPRLLNSPLFDYKKFSHDLTKELRLVWKKWCSNEQSTSKFIADK